jgi:hypothetical protein
MFLVVILDNWIGIELYFLKVEMSSWDNVTMWNVLLEYREGKATQAQNLEYFLPIRM